MKTIARSCALAALGVASLVTIVDGPAVAAASTLGCTDVVHDPDGVLDLDRVTPAVAGLAAQLDGDVRVRVEGTLDGGLDRRIEQLVEQCPGWKDTDTDELADDMVVVMYSPVERENSIFYGADLGPILARRWDAATDAMIVDLRAGDWTAAVLAGLGALTRDPAGSSGTDDEPSAGGGLPVGVVFWLVVLGGVAVLSYVARQRGWTSGGVAGGSDDDGSSWTGARRRRSSFGFRSRSSGRSLGRRSGGSRRAGGGTKRW